MERIRITTAEHPLFPQAMELYRNSFPDHELREAASQRAILSHPAYHFDVLLENRQFIGEILYWDIGQMRYVEHFCILPEQRNRHYGQQALALLSDRPVLLEIDPPVDPISCRRLGFYQRCGFRENSFAHVHPPYHAGNSGHALRVLSRPDLLTQEEFQTFSDFLRQVVMKDAF